MFNYFSKKFEAIFPSHTVEIVTACPLQAIMHKPDLAGHMVLWATELSGYDIRYIPMVAIKSQVLADSLAEFTVG